jgi:hypothetical protein
VKQLVDSQSIFPDGPLVVDGKDLTQVIIVGRVNGIKVQSNSVVYSIDDGTGLVDVKKYSELNDDQDGENPNASADLVPEGSYVKVFLHQLLTSRLLVKSRTFNPRRVLMHSRFVWLIILMKSIFIYCLLLPLIWP